MEIKYTKHFLTKLEELISACGYILRYEKGHFKSGYCLLKDNKVAVINKFFPLEGRITSIIDILKEIKQPEGELNEAQMKLWKAIKADSDQQDLPL